MAARGKGPPVVYFIEVGPGGPIKIGTSRNVRQRLRQLQAKSAAPLSLWGTVPGGEDLEEEYHRMWHHLRRPGEQFEPAPDLLAWIRRLLHPEATEEQRRRRRELQAIDWNSVLG
jgi:hypothetical protein